MADNNQSGSRFPLPPNMTPPRSGNRSGPGLAQPPGGHPLAAPHMTTESIPHLSSAPSSGNYYDVHAGAVQHPPPPPPPPPAPPAHFANLPPPPPMPPVGAISSQTSTISSSSSATPTICPLPPPPVMSGVTKSAATSDPSSSEPLVWKTPTEEPPAIPLTTFCPSNIRYLAHRQCHIPILVLGTESAHKLAWKNQLRLVDMLEGLARSLPEFTNRQIPQFRSTAKSLTLQWKDVPLTFVTPEQLAQPMQYETSQELLQQQAQLKETDGNLEEELDLLEDQVDALLQDNPQRDSYDYMHDYEERVQEESQVTKDAFGLTSPLSIPWLLRYRHALDYSTDQMPHDLTACPPVCLLICTTQEVSPLIDCLRELGSRHYLPSCFSNGLYDPKIMRQEAVVLHDTVEGPRDWDEAGLRSSLQRNFGPNASILRINGILPQTAMQLSREETADEWGGKGQCGNCLSHSDRVVLRQYLEGLTTSSVLPALERRLSELNVVVSDRKKGVKNVFKSFWRKPKEANPEDTITKATSEVTYRFDSIESQTRLLADTLFLVKDFDGALSMYRLIRDDYKHDKSMMHYASVQEMMALCMYFLDPYSRAKEIVGHVETALLAYSKAAEDERPIPAGQNKNQRATTATHATRCATRLCLWLSATSDTILGGRHLEVADLLASASSHETALGAAVLLEQSSAQYYNADLYRKYAFHMLMSGHMFRTAQQDAHAFRCFTSALYIYRDKPWNELHNHLRSALAAQLYSMGRMAVSVQLYARLVGIPSGGSVSIKSQQKFVNNLLFICNEHPKKALVGADRMAAPAELSNSERDRYRTERLDGIVEVIEYTRGAQRILELPRVRLPTVLDTSLIVEAPEDKRGSADEPLSFGILDKGSESIWKELQLTTKAELRAADASKDQSTGDEVTTQALSKIKDADIRRVIAQIDRAEQNRNLQERNKRSSSYKGETPPTRAREEPLQVSFTLSNPLSIPVDMSDIQLVARMTNEQGRAFTNMEAIRITAMKPDKKTWTFQSSSLGFQVPEFSRLSPVVGSSNKAWTAGEDVEVPFFVVSKQNLSLDAQGTTSITLGVCPLVQGSLEILGVRSRLLDDVWTYHPFSIKGPRLHNTQSNRAHKVRADPVLLKATVKQDMPCLTAQLLRSDGEGSDEPLLQGQKGMWILRLSNIGTAPATNIVVKTSLPWVNIPSTDHQVDKENAPVSTVVSLESQAKSCCVGPTGTLMSLPVRGQHLRKEGSLQPGETVDLTIKIKAGVGGGMQDFYMLYRYELDDESIQSNARPHRWLKKMYKVPVYPSLSVSASISPSTWRKEEHILSVELTNHRNDRPNGIGIKLDKLSLVSRRYRMERMDGQLDEGGASSLEVDWRERVTVHYRLVPTEKDANICLLSECPFSNTPSSVTPSALSPTGDYLCLEKANAKFQETWKTHQIDLMNAQNAKNKEDQHPQSITSIRKANTGTKRQEGDDRFDEVDIGATHPTSIGKLFPNDRSLTKVNLICSWSADVLASATIYGEHQLRSIPVRPARKAVECPITISSNYSPTVSHNFEKGPSVTPFKIILRNQLVRSSVTFTVEVLKSKDIGFIGAQTLQWSLEGGEELVLPMKAVISDPGVYDLQSVKVTLVDEDDDEDSKDEEGPLAFDFGVQWLINVAGEDQ